VVHSSVDTLFGLACGSQFCRRAFWTRVWFTVLQTRVLDSRVVHSSVDTRFGLACGSQFCRHAFWTRVVHSSVDARFGLVWFTVL
jgi:hypothetical protein